MSPRAPGGGRKPLYDPAIQLEKLPPELENPYHRALGWLGRCLPIAVALFLAVTLLEGATGYLSELSGSAWYDVVGRASSTYGGQGNVGYRTLIALYHRAAAKGPVRAVFSGDSVLAPGLGPGTINDLATEDLSASLVRGAVNLSQEGREFGANALFIERLALDPGIQRDKPPLVVDIDLKYFGTTWSLTPSFPVEIGLCARRPDPEDPTVEAHCTNHVDEWPATLWRLSRLSPFLYDGLQGQLDFFLTFVQRAPAFHYYQRDRGEHPLRAVAPGLVEAALVARDYSRQRPASNTIHYVGAEKGVEFYIAALSRGFHDPNHPKQPGLSSLIRAIGRWPGPAIVMLVRPSVGLQRAMNDSRIQEFDWIQTELGRRLRQTGKSGLVYFANRDVMQEEDDYTDGDHLTPKGHRKLAEHLEKLLR